MPITPTNPFKGRQCALVVEGFFDCLRVHQAGYRNVVAWLGVSLSEVQEQLLLAGVY